MFLVSAKMKEKKKNRQEEKEAWVVEIGFLHWERCGPTLLTCLGVSSSDRFGIFEIQVLVLFMGSVVV